MSDTVDFWKEKFESYLKRLPSEDGSHDLSHFRRVFSLCKKFADEAHDIYVLLAAAYFHDVVSYPKDSPKRALSSQHAAIKAEEILKELGYFPEKIDNIKHCIEAHSFSANIDTKTEEAKILQDADRLESLGAIGLARTFYVSGLMKRSLFSGDDPFAERRELDDKEYAVDHFFTKLLKIPETMKTVPGREEALRRAKVLEDFLEHLKVEIGGDLQVFPE